MGAELRGEPCDSWSSQCQATRHRNTSSDRAHQDGCEEINAVIDTGYTDFLTLSHEIIDELDLDFAINVQAFLADGSEEILPMFNVTVTWDGEPRRVRAIATRGESLLGMAMLHGRRLVVEVIEGGQVAVQPLN